MEIALHYPIRCSFQSYTVCRYISMEDGHLLETPTGSKRCNLGDPQVENGAACCNKRARNGVENGVGTCIRAVNCNKVVGLKAYR